MLHLISALFMIPIEALYPYIIFILAGRILLCSAVYYDLKRRASSNRLPWLVSALIFGLLGAVLFGVFNGKSNKKGKASIFISLILCYVLVLAGTAAFTAYYVAPKSGEYEPEFEYTETFYMGEKVYKNDACEDIIYDKMGNTYTYDERNNFRYYDKSGNAYIFIFRNENEKMGYLNCETNEFIEADGETSFYIDENGWFTIDYDDSIIKCNQTHKNTINYIAFDRNGNLFYDTTDCTWSENGELLFVESYHLGKYTYDKLMKKIDKEFHFDSAEYSKTWNEWKAELQE